MSLMRPVLNAYLRAVEKRRLATVSNVSDLRRSLNRSARLFFHSPRGTRMFDRHLAGGSRFLEIQPKHRQGDLVIFYIHGGGFVFGSPRTHAAMLAQLAARSGARVMMPWYRLAPEAPYPAAIDDIETAYLDLIRSGVAGSDIIIGGDSAGGTLTFNLLGQILANGWSKPRAVFGFSPFVDFAREGASYRENAQCEAILPVKRAGEMVDMYLAAADPANPRISPLRAEYKGAPPVWITVGDTEILRDDVRRLNRCLCDQGVTVTFVQMHDLPHVWPIFHNVLPEARRTLDDLAAWIKAQSPAATES